MGDFPAASRTPTTILNSLDQTHHACVWPYTAGSGGSTWPAANRAIYCPILVEDPVTVTQMAVLVTAQSGNLDVGIYSETGVRLVSKGSTAVGAANAVQAVDITDTYLVPGVYFLALCVDNTTAAFQRASNSTGYLQACGVQQQAVGAVTLPDPATFANPASSYIPMITALCMSAVI